MDIRREGWFGQLVLSGVRQPSAHRGSILHIIGESLKDLQSLRARNDADGESEIVIRIRNKPFDTSKESAQYMDKTIEVEDLLESEDTLKPIEGENYGEFHDRLISEGLGPVAAQLIASEWFGVEPNEHARRWLVDGKAIRFRELNSRDEAYAAALPAEYESLKAYVIQVYPTFVEHLTFRTA